MIDLPDIASESEEGSCDLTFAAASHSVRPDGSHEIVARGIHHGTPVGFTAVLLPKWEPWEIDGIPRTLYRGGVTIGADGPAGDAFLKAINELYGTREAPGRSHGYGVKPPSPARRVDFPPKTQRRLLPNCRHDAKHQSAVR